MFFIQLTLATNVSCMKSITKTAEEVSDIVGNKIAEKLRKLLQIVLNLRPNKYHNQ